MAVYYGSESGTCEAMARRAAPDASFHGFNATAGPLNTARENLLEDRPVMIFTCSYEGKPPSNAVSFVDWLETLKGSELNGVKYAVLAVGTETGPIPFIEYQSVSMKLLKGV